MRELAHRLIALGVGAFNRNPWTHERLALLPRGDFYEADGLWTNHAAPFLRDPAFRRAYARGVRVAGVPDIRWRVHTILWAAERASRLEGAFVECGTGRGVMASAICEHLGWIDRPFYLFDRFTRPGNDVRMEIAYADNSGEVAANFREWPGVRLVVGSVPESLIDVGSVAFLHLDLDHAESEAAAVRHFWPHLVIGGVMIFNSYGFPTYVRERESADRLSRELGFSILALPTGQGLVIK